MGSQSELELEEYLIQILTKQGYTPTIIHNEDTLLANLKTQLEKLNQTQFSPEEFTQIRSYLSTGSVFEKANKLRGYLDLKIDKNPTKYIKFLNQEDYSQNTFQIAQQIKIQGKYQNRYDVTILINGLPLVQIELKRRGLELKEAFNQINRYHRDSYGYSAGLFQYIQIFIISNGVNTKYFANNKDQSFKQTFYWTNESNQKISDLGEFAVDFLATKHLAKMICQYIVLTTKSILMILRPYQIYAVEAIIKQVKTSRENGYIWHTTGSGKTLTSFKTAQILVQFKEIDKVVFVVDRKDLDAQTSKEFNTFSAGCVDITKNTRFLVDQFLGKNSGGAMKGKLIITTIQKLNAAIDRESSLDQMNSIKSQRIIFIFDECHRSQFGKTHHQIKSFFENTQFIGFTGTPILEKNAINNQFGKKTTAELFGQRLHQYVIVDAINDQNVLPFSIEYVGKYQLKDSATEIDIETDGNIDTKEVLDSNERLNKIVDYIIAHHDRKTHQKEFSAIFATSSIDVLYEYYKQFKSKSKDLKVAAIFSYIANEEDPNANGINETDTDGALDMDRLPINESGREKLEKIISNYNLTYGTSFSTKDQHGFYHYFDDVANRVKLRDHDKHQQKKDQYIDILLVVNMFLTGFDSPSLNTIYVDKNLKYHGLVQAFSRTNRILNEKKSHGQVVCFRNLKHETDEAISLFSHAKAKDTILMKPYGEYLNHFNEVFDQLFKLTPTLKHVDALMGEEQKLAFINTFRELLKTKNILSGFVDFKWQHLGFSEQNFEDFKSKYLDLYDEIKRPITPKESILKEVDFLIELIHRDEINVSYILKLIDAYLKNQNEEKAKQHQQILNLLSAEPKLRNKKDLILSFIDEINLKNGNQGFILDDIEDHFYAYVSEQKTKAFTALCATSNLDENKTQRMIDQYLYDGRDPLNEEIANAYLGGIKLRDRQRLIPQIRSEILHFVEQYELIQSAI